MARYQSQYFIEQTPSRATAISYRQGAVQDMLTGTADNRGVVPDHVAENTGHYSERTCALWAYSQAREVLSLPGALVLSGFKGPGFGRLTKGPVPPTLEAIGPQAVDEYGKMTPKFTSFMHDAVSRSNTLHSKTDAVYS